MNRILKSPVLEGKDVFSLIPQQPPIRMVDTLWHNDDTVTVSGFTILPDNIFCKDGFMAEPGLIENIAQSAALRVGYMASQMQQDNQPITPPVGYIGAIKNLKIHRLPEVGNTIRTEITIMNIVFDVTIIRGVITLNDDAIAECEMKIFLTGN